MRVPDHSFARSREKSFVRFVLLARVKNCSFYLLARVKSRIFVEIYMKNVFVLICLIQVIFSESLADRPKCTTWS